MPFESGASMRSAHRTLLFSIPAAHRLASCRSVAIARHGQKFSPRPRSGICRSPHRSKTETQVLWSDIRYSAGPTSHESARAVRGSAESSIATGALSGRLFAWDSGSRPGLPERRLEAGTDDSQRECLRLPVRPPPRGRAAKNIRATHRPCGTQTSDARHLTSAPSADCRILTAWKRHPADASASRTRMMPPGSSARTAAASSAS